MQDILWSFFRTHPEFYFFILSVQPRTGRKLVPLGRLQALQGFEAQYPACCLLQQLSSILWSQLDPAVTDGVAMQ